MSLTSALEKEDIKLQLVSDVKRVSAPEFIPWLALGLIVAVGLLARVIGLGHRSLWLDEAWVANLAQSENFLRAILYQKAPYWSPLPLLFAGGVKIMISILGASEAAFRLLPCLFGAGSVFLLCFLSREIFPESRIWMVSPGLLALNPTAIYYSKELKQYSGELFFTILLLSLFMLMNKRKASPVPMLSTFFLTALIGIGFGIPLILLVISISVVLAVRFHRQQNWKAFFVLSSATAVIILSEIVVYVLWLRPQIALSYASFWDSSMFPPHEVSAIPRWLINRGFSYFSYDFGFPTLILGNNLTLRGEFLLSYVVCVICCLGIVCFFREKRRDLLYIYALTMVSLVILSFLRKWPLGGSRVSLFLLPFPLIFVTRGVKELSTITRALFPNKHVGLVLGTAGSLLILPVQGLDENLWHLKEREEMKPVVEYVKDHLNPETQRIYVYYYAKEAFQYYWRPDHRYPDQKLYHFASTSAEDPAVQMSEIVTYCESLPDSVDSVYFIFSHIRRSHAQEILSLSRKEFGHELDSKQATGASTYVFKLRKERPSMISRVPSFTSAEGIKPSEAGTIRGRAAGLSEPESQKELVAE